MTMKAEQSNETDLFNPAHRLAREFAGELGQTRDNLLHLSNLHHDFVKECLAAIDAKKARAGAPLAGEYFSHIVARSLQLEDSDRRMLAAATLAMYGYIYMVDYELDQKGHLDARLSMAASALLAWSIATIGRYTAGTPYADVFLENVNAAMAGQYEDIQQRGLSRADRRRSDVDKNRPALAMLAGFCAAAREADDRLLRAAEQILGPVQILDDFSDVKEDYDENNLTDVVKIVRECIAAAGPLSKRDMQLVLIRDPRTNALLAGAVHGFERALLLLDPRRDGTIIEFLSDTRNRCAALLHALKLFQGDPLPELEAEVFYRIGELRATQTW